MALYTREGIRWPIFYLVLFSVLFFSLDYFPYDVGLDVLRDTVRVFSYMVGIVVWLLLAIVINRLIRYFIWEKIFERRGRTIPKLLKDMVGALIMMAAIGGIISVVFKKDLTILLAATGGVGVIVGLAIKELIADVFAGLALNAEQPFQIGDVIRIGDIEGEVIELNWRATHLLTKNNTVLVYPNARISMAVIDNLYKRGTHFRGVFDLRLDHGVAPERALRLLNSAVKHVRDQSKDLMKELPADLEASAVAVDIDDVGVLYQIRYWLPHYDNRIPIRNRVISAVMRELEQAGITPAVPQQKIHHLPLQTHDASSEERVMRLLRDTRIFANIEEEDALFLVRSMTMLRFKPGDVIIKRGTAGASMYFILEGMADVYIWIAAQETEIRVGSMISGKAFGEMSLLTGDPRSATIKAHTDIILYELTNDHLGVLLEKRPELAGIISSVIAEYQLKDRAMRESLSETEQEEQTKTAAQELLGKIRSFFNLR
ncbi:MAG: mechanosensitive ion channel family protein [Myxococcota bacterium]|nr:mechanosensitive ion channel family protein [Myxococcota bacterium]